VFSRAKKAVEAAVNFEFATASRIIFGAGSVRQVAPAARQIGSRVLLVTGRSPELFAVIASCLEEVGLPFIRFEIHGEPTLECVRQATKLADSGHCDIVVGFGGGSVMDTAKAVAILLTNGGDPLDYVEVVGRGKSFTNPAASLIAIPTTAGTGAEVTRNAVLTSTEHKLKVSIRSSLMLPKLTVVDPDLTLSLPPGITAFTGLDALTQLIEPYVSCRANPITDALCVDGMRRAAGALLRAYYNGHDRRAREDMALASLFGGLALANAGLGAVHGFAAPIGGRFHAPHGAICAALLPYVMEVNLRALRQRDPDGEGLRRYETVARILTGKPDAVSDDGPEWVRRLCEKLGIPRLSSYGIKLEDVPDIVERAAKASSMRGNPTSLTLDEMREILMRSL